MERMVAFQRLGRKLSASVMVVLIFYGCSTNNGEDLSGKELLTSVNWKISAAEGTYSVLVGGIPFINDDFSLTDSLEDCEKDDYIRFFTNDTYQVIDDGDRCDGSPADGILDSGSYDFDGANNKIALDIFDDDIVDIPDGITIDPYFTVKELSTRFFKLEKVIEESFTDNGVTFKVSANINLTMTPK